ncbi:MAG: NAD(P)H-dependent oxidoreductase [Acidimicrobiia bacterium]|nr:NAD(P)H-dependent oxidoreductase [Acidimicrobiia bacterium]
MAQEIIIAGVVGSLRHDSFTRLAVRIALEGAAETGAVTRLIDLCDYELPFCNGDRTTSLPEVVRLRQDVVSGHGLILGTPEYHGGYSGVLKNAIDLMGFDEFEGKIVGLVGVSGGSMGALQALQGLRVIGRALHAWVIPQQASIPMAYQELAQNSPTREVYEQRLREVGRQVARFAALHSSPEAIEFLRAWEEAPSNPGGED